MHSTPGGVSATPTTDGSRRSLLLFVAVFALVVCSPDLADFHDLYVSSHENLFKKNLTYDTIRYDTIRDAILTCA